LFLNRVTEKDTPMPYGPFHRQTPEYQKKLERRELRQLFGSDAPDVEWMEQLLERLNAIPPDCGFEEKDYDDMEKARRILRQLCVKAGFDPSQPRVPAGNSEGGEWTDTGGGSGARTPSGSGGLHVPIPVFKPHIPGQPVSPRTIDKTIEYLESNARGKPTGWCARHVRQALEANGIKVEKPKLRPGKDAAQARDYGPKLVDAGFKPVLSDTKPAISPDPGKLRKGDVTVIQSTSRNEAGHMAMYDGYQWISDYKQPRFWPGEAYKNELPDYVIYRLPSERW
jgi:hypothetical protein